MKPDDRRRDLHFLNADGMVACNPRDREAAHRAWRESPGEPWQRSPQED